MNTDFATDSPATPEILSQLSFVGARCHTRGVFYRVWAPERQTIQVILCNHGQPRRSFLLEREEDGYFSGHDPRGKAGDRYLFCLDEQTLAPDPASRYQPLGVFAPSEVVENRFEWKASNWIRPPLRGRVIYELHVGTFTPGGTFRSAIERLDHLVALGVNTIEIMPVADFPGRWNWGYDGVMLYAPARCYGAPDDFRALVDAAHERGISVILDVVYNHLGPTGNHLSLYSDRYFHPERRNLWGRSLNFDGEHSRPVRDFFVQNVLYWLDEFRIDGFRLDATHSIEDSSPKHLIAEIGEAAHNRGAFVIAENEWNDAGIVSHFGQTAWGLDGVWADDFHHTVRVALTGQRESHFGSYEGTTDEWVATLLHGWLYRGQYFPHWKRSRGTECGHLAPEQLVFCISNHDQTGNRPLGDRLHHVIPRAAYRAVSMLLCLSPYTPMLFMGQEWAASTPFPYFTDHPGELGEGMARHRLEEFKTFNAIYDADTIKRMPNPQAPETFSSAVLNWEESKTGICARTLALYRECLHLRARETLFQNSPRSRWSVRKLKPDALGLRWRDTHGDWLFIMTLKTEFSAVFSEDEFLSPRPGRIWQAEIFSNDRRFAENTWQPPLSLSDSRLRLIAPAACLLREVPRIPAAESV